MSQMNVGRIVGGGLVAGVVMNVIDAGANGYLLAAQWQREANALNGTLLNQAAAMSTVGWIVVDFVLGIATIWTYAAIRPRFGPGPRTAMIAAVALFVVGHLFYASYVFMGLFSASLIGASSLAGLVAIAAGAYVGGALYRE